MKILLINPGFKRKMGKTNKISLFLLPMGLAYIAAVLKKENVDVKILDANVLKLDDRGVVKYVEEYGPDVVGFSVVTLTARNCFEMAEIIKRRFPDIKIVFGGPHPTSLPNESISKGFIDFVVVGEGENTAIELIRELKKSKIKNFKKIDGLVFKKGTKKFFNKSRETIEDLDSLPFPEIDLLPLSLYKSLDTKSPKFTTILTSRGCPGMCVFCNKLIFGNRCKMRSAKNIVTEIGYLNQKYGFKDFHILDDLFTNDRKRVVEFCNLLIKKKLKITWKCANGIRASTVDYELLKLMKKSGCYMLNYGAESGNQRILNNMKKGQTLNQVERAVRLTKAVGINCGCCFMFGNLGENKQTMQETIDFAKKLNPDIAIFSILTPFPGTIVENIIKKEGKIFVKSWDDYDNLDGRAIFEHGKLKREDMERMYKKAYSEFYLRPEYILSQIFKRRSWNELKNRISSFFALLEM